jgi:serine/threonine-protein kinase HipA
VRCAPNGGIVFEFDGFPLEISPFHLPRAAAGPKTFPDLQDKAAFQGLPGVLADALPDRFGTAVIRHYFAQRGEPERADSPIDRLQFVGNRAMGALVIDPDLHPSPGDDVVDINDLMQQSRSVVQGRTNDIIPELLRVGASAGGMRPKAVVLWNRTTQQFKCVDARRARTDEDWLIKFDGVRPVGADIQAKDTSNDEPQPYMRIEYAYSLMARAAGIAMPETHLLIERNYAHFMVRRFDRMDGTRVHQHTLGGLLHADYNLPGAVAYEDYMEAIARLGLNEDAKEEAYRRIVFNFAAVNQDDHIKNLSFLMDQNGSWDLSPAYDVTYARGHGWTRTHQMTLRGMREGVTRDDLRQFGRAHSIRRAEDLLENVIAAVARWPEFADAAGVPREWIEKVSGDMLSCGV